MPNTEPYTPRRIGIVVVETVILALVLLYLADYCGWRLFTEAGGAGTSSAAARPRSAPLT